MKASGASDKHTFYVRVDDQTTRLLKTPVSLIQRTTWRFMTIEGNV